MKTYRPWEPDRTYLLPPSTREWLPDDHLALFILDVLDELDLSPIEVRIQQKDPRGEKPYSPRMMVALLLYGYCRGIFSSRGLAAATWTDLGARVIAAESHPHFTTFNQFRLDHLDALAGLFAQALGLCERAGLVELGHVAIDGTKIQANASKHKAMSYDRMKETEERLRREVEKLLSKADEVDRAEDAQFGPDHDGNPLPEELRRRESRRERLRQAREALEAEALAARKLELEAQADRARQAAADAPDPHMKRMLERRGDRRQSAAQDLGDVDTKAVPGSQDGLPFHIVQHEPNGTPKPKAQRNFTDPDSRIMAASGSFLQGYNCQIAVDDKAQIIVAQIVTNQSPDLQHLQPLLEQVRSNLGRNPDQCTADAGYWSDANGQYCVNAEIDAYISTRRRPHAEEEDSVVPDSALAPNAKSAEGKAMEAKVTGPDGKIIYAKRKHTVEPVFGETKDVRGFRRFKLRGLRKVRAEFALVSTGHNLLKLWRKRKK